MSLDHLAKLWADGATLTQIEQSTGLTKGAAIGHIFRARKAGDPRFPPRPSKPKPKLRRVKPVDEVVATACRRRGAARTQAQCYDALHADHLGQQGAEP